MTSSVSNDKKPTTDSIEIKLLTLNCWGLKFVSAHRLERIHAIADFIASCSPFNSPSQSIDSIQAFSPDLTTSSHHHHHLPKPNPLPSSSLLSTKPLIKTTNHSHHHITTNHPHQTSSSSSTTTTTSHSSSHQTSFEPHSKSFDLIALQELWVYHDFLVIRDRAKQAGFRFSKFFHRVISSSASPSVVVSSTYPSSVRWRSSRLTSVFRFLSSLSTPDPHQSFKPSSARSAQPFSPPLSPSLPLHPGSRRIGREAEEGPTHHALKLLALCPS